MINPLDNRIDDSIAGPRQDMAPSRRARTASVTDGIRRALAIVDDAIASIDHWRRVSQTVQALLRLDDAKLKAMGLERNEVVTRVLQISQARRAHRNSR